jgi:hypothetical protein
MIRPRIASALFFCSSLVCFGFTSGFLNSTTRTRIQATKMKNDISQQMHVSRSSRVGIHFLSMQIFAGMVHTAAMAMESKRRVLRGISSYYSNEICVLIIVIFPQDQTSPAKQPSQRWVNQPANQPVNQSAKRCH